MLSWGYAVHSEQLSKGDAYLIPSCVRKIGVPGFMSSACVRAQELFHVPHAEASAKLQTAKALMERWFAVYLEVRHLSAPVLLTVAAPMGPHPSSVLFPAGCHCTACNNGNIQS